MAVKHKVVECVDTKPECRLTIILRALQDISMQPGVQGIEMGRICEKIVSSLGTVAVPTKTDEYLQFMENIKSVQEILANTCCSNENLIFTTLRAFYNDISNPKKQVQPTMSVVLQLIDVKMIPKAVKWILNSGYSEQNLEQALMTLCEWLSRWTLTPNLGILVLQFMEGLERDHHYDILVEATMTYVERLFKLLILPEPRKNIGPVVYHMLTKIQNSPTAFHKVIPHVRPLLASLERENTESSRVYLQDVVNLCVALMDLFPGYGGGVYEGLRGALVPYKPTISYKQALDCSTWSDGAELAIVPFCNNGKVGLNNLGNTCYMNSVLQALFMTKLFRNDLLTSNRDTVPLLAKLQMLFALLQHSKRASLSPCDILTLARPPGFQPGHQHDSSEFLGYLLDVLHEHEKSVYVNVVGAAAQGDDGGENNTIVQRSFGGKALTVSRCGTCGTNSERSDNFRELQLSFPTNRDDKHSVQSLLDYYLQPEKLCEDNQYHCDNCHGLTDGERVTVVVEPPPRLVLTLKYFGYDPVSQQRTKLLQRVQLDAAVHLGPVQYNLYAVVVHSGSSVDSGHYYTYAKDGEEWYKFNDYSVLPSSEEELCDLRPPATAYILFYSRCDCADPENLPRPSLSPKLEAALVRDDTDQNTTERRLRPLKTYSNNNNNNNSNNRHNRNNPDDPPPPGCGGGGSLNSNANRFVC